MRITSLTGRVVGPQLGACLDSRLPPLLLLVVDCLDRPLALAGVSLVSNRTSQCLEQVASEQPPVQRHLSGALGRPVRPGEEGSLELLNQPASVHQCKPWLRLSGHLQEALELPQVNLVVEGFSAQLLLHLAPTQLEALEQRQANLGECLGPPRASLQLLEQQTRLQGSEDLEHKLTSNRTKT